MKNFGKIISIFILYVIICIVINPSLYMQASFDGLKAWAINVLPSVLPFIFFTKILSAFGQVESMSRIFAKPVAKFYNCPPCASYVYLMSIISGYPVGAKMTADLYESGKITKSQALHMTSFCSNSGPMFIIGSVGATMLGSAKVGYLIFLAHAIGALVNGLIYRKLSASGDEQIAKKNIDQKSFSVGDAISDSALSMISVGAIIAIFFVVIESLNPIISLLPISLQGFAAGLVEITKGCIEISATMPLKISALLCTFVISFGGISTILQSLTMLNRLKMPVKLFVLQKFTQAIISTFIMAFFVF